MSHARYAVTPQPIDVILNYIKTNEIAIPEIQRPFVWDAINVRNLMDSLYQGFPVGYLITWRNPTVKLKDGSLSAGKRILIDGQQRVTALMAALLGREILTKDYKTVRIKIAFNPQKEKFEVSNPAIEKDNSWLPDIAAIFSPDAKMLQITRNYVNANPATNEDDIFSILERLKKITNNHVGIIELSDELDIETVTEIFIRVNSAGVSLSQADFAMSKISVNEIYGGNTLRKAIDYFAHLALKPEFYTSIQHNDHSFAKTDLFHQMAWMKNENDDIYDPTITDILRVAFTTEFKRGKLQDLVALLSGRNFETKQFEDAIIEDSFNRLKSSVMQFMNETNFKRFLMIIRSAGFVDADLITSKNAIDFAYIVYLTMRNQRIPAAEIERFVRRWYVMSMLTGRYSGSPETLFDLDIRQINERGIERYAQDIERAELSDAFWNASLVQSLDTSAASSPYFRIFQAGQVKLNDKGFLSRTISVRELVEVKSDIHHIFPRDFLKRNGMARTQYNQVANFVVAQSEINIAIGNKEPAVYFKELIQQCSGGKKLYGDIIDPIEMQANLAMNCIPAGMENLKLKDYPDFLAERRKLMAQKIRVYFEGL